MTPEQQAVINAAIEWVEDRLYDDLSGTSDALREAVKGLQWKPQSEELVWVARTLADVRAGDTVRLPAVPDLPARVVFAAPADWHVHSGGDGPKAHYGDAPLEHRMINVRLDFEGGPRDSEGRPILREMPADVPIEIQLSAEELRAIELLGWDNRVMYIGPPS